MRCIFSKNSIHIYLTLQKGSVYPQNEVLKIQLNLGGKIVFPAEPKLISLLSYDYIFTGMSEIMH